MKTAFSYIRFSHPDQSKGDSEDRQGRLAEAYCHRNGWTLSNKSYKDLGVSAWRGRNALVGNLGEFLKAIESGAVKPGNALIVESVDRISRQGIDEGYDTCKKILKAGIRIITLSPEREFGPDAVKSLSKGALELQLILERAAEESERKSQRVGAAWAKKKQEDTHQTGHVTTRRLPLWVKWVEKQGGTRWIRDDKADKAKQRGELQLIPERANVVRRIFSLAGRGYGHGLIVNWLIEKAIPPFRERGEGKKEPKWSRSYVAKLLANRAAIGEYQPMAGRAGARKPDGPPIPDYFPAVVSESQWYAARAGAAERRLKPGRVGNHVNLFAGLLRNARDGDTYYASKKEGGEDAPRVLVNSDAMAGRSELVSFPLETFENAILSMLAEIDPREVFGRDDEPDEIQALARELETVDGRISEFEKELLDGEVSTVVKHLRQLEGQKGEITRKLTEAKERASKPVKEAWEEAQSLLGTIAKSPDKTDVRLRLRAALRRTIDSIWLLVIPGRGHRGRYRGAAAQVWFKEGGCRNYLILHRYAHASAAARTPSKWWAWSTKLQSLKGTDSDLRKRKDAEEQAAILSADDDLSGWVLFGPRVRTPGEPDKVRHFLGPRMKQPDGQRLVDRKQSSDD